MYEMVQNYLSLLLSLALSLLSHFVHCSIRALVLPSRDQFLAAGSLQRRLVETRNYYGSNGWRWSQGDGPLTHWKIILDCVSSLGNSLRAVCEFVHACLDRVDHILHSHILLSLKKKSLSVEALGKKHGLIISSWIFFVCVCVCVCVCMCVCL